MLNIINIFTIINGRLIESGNASTELPAVYIESLSNDIWFANLLFFLGIIGVAFSSSTKPLVLMLSLEIMYLGLILNFLNSYVIITSGTEVFVFGYLLLLLAALDSVLLITIFVLIQSAGEGREE